MASPVSGKVILDAEVYPEGSFVRYIINGPKTLEHDVLSPSSTIPPIVYGYSWQTTDFPDGSYDITVELWGDDPLTIPTEDVLLSTDFQYGVQVSNLATLTAQIPTTGLTTETVQLICSTDKAVSSGVIFKVSKDNQGVLGGTVTSPVGTAPNFDYIFEVKPGQLPPGTYWVQCQAMIGGQYVTQDGWLEMSSPTPTITPVVPVPGSSFSDYLKMEAYVDQSSTAYGFIIEAFDDSGNKVYSTKTSSTAVQKLVNQQYVWSWNDTWTPPSAVPSSAKIVVTPYTAALSGSAITVSYNAATTVQAFVQKPTGTLSGKAVFTVWASQEKVEADINVFDSGNAQVAGPLGAGFVEKTTDSSGKTWYLFQNKSQTWDTTAVPDGDYKVIASIYPFGGTPFKTDPVTYTVKNQATTTPIVVTWASPTPGSTGLSGIQELVVKTEPVASEVKYTIINSTGSHGPYYGSVMDTSTPQVFTYEWDTTTWPDGDYKIYAQAYEAGVESGDPAVLSLSINNTSTSQEVKISVSQPDPNSPLGSTLYVYASLNQEVKGALCRFYIRVPATNSTAAQVKEKTEVTASLGKTCQVASWDISTLADGKYELYAEAIGPSQTTPLATATVGGLVKEASQQGTGLTVSLTEPMTGKYSGKVSLKATVNKSVDKVVAQIKPLSTNLNVSTKDLVLANPTKTTDSQGNILYVWSAVWDTVAAAVPNGDYGISVTATAGSESVKSASQSTVTVANQVGETKTDISIVQPASYQVATPLSGTVTFSAKASPTPNSVTFELVNADQSTALKLPATVSSTTGLWSAKWDSTKHADGSWIATAVAVADGKESGRSSSLGFAVKNELPLTVAMTSPDGEVSGPTGMAATTGKKAEKLIFRFYSSDATLKLPGDVTASPADGSNTTWSATWDTQASANGIYLIRAIAYAGSEEATSDPKKVAVNNKTTTEETTTAVTVSLTAPTAGSTQSGPFAISAKTDRQVGRMTFQLTDAATGQSKVWDGVSDSAGIIWKASVNEAASPLAEGQYKLQAVAVIAGAKVGESSSIGLTIKAPVRTEETAEEPTTTAQAPTVSLPSLSATVSGNQTLAAKASANVSTVNVAVKNLSSGVVHRIAAAKSSDGLWRALWQTNSMPDGRYDVRVNARTADGQTASAGPAVVTVKNAVETPTGTAPTPTGTAPTPTGTAPTTETKEETVPLNQVQIIPNAVIRQAVLTKPEGTTEVTVASLPTVQPSATAPTGGQTETTLDPECVKYGIGAAKCESWLSWRNRADNECRNIGILTKEECVGYLRAKYGTVSQEESDQKTAGLITVEKLTRLEQGLVPLIGSTFKVKPAAPTDTASTEAGSPAAPARPDLSATYQKLAQEDVAVELKQNEAEDTLSEYLPIKPQKDVNLLVHASPAYVTNRDGQVQKQLPALIMVDDDQDGLPNDTEKRLGTDPNNPDSDGDGFNDKTELENGYDPLRVGKRLGESDVKITPVDAAIITGSPMEQPKAAGTESDELQVEAAETISGQAGTDGAEPVLRLRGKAKPNQTITIYVYSYLPLVLTTTANDDGTWSYDLSDGVTDGEHEAYVAVNDDTGKIKEKSAPLAFLVAEAQAATEDQYFSPTVLAAEAPAKRLMSWYLIGAGLLILGAVIIGIMIFSRATKRHEPEF